MNTYKNQIDNRPTAPAVKNIAPVQSETASEASVTPTIKMGVADALVGSVAAQVAVSAPAPEYPEAEDSYAGHSANAGQQYALPENMEPRQPVVRLWSATQQGDAFKNASLLNLDLSNYIVLRATQTKFKQKILLVVDGVRRFYSPINGHYLFEKSLENVIAREMETNNDWRMHYAYTTPGAASALISLLKAQRALEEEQRKSAHHTHSAPTFSDRRDARAANVQSYANGAISLSEMQARNSAIGLR
jgi:hypothetical protein